MKKLIIYILILLLLMGIMVTSAAAEKMKLNVTGYYKLFFTGFKLPSVKALGETISKPPIGAVNNRLRLSFSMKAASWISLQASYDISPRIQDTLLFGEDIFFSAVPTGGYRVADFDSRLYPREGEAVSSFGLFHNLDRFFVTIKTSFADIFIGRQAIAWGSAKFNNPTDVVAPFTFNELDTEERSGVDAVRVRIPLGMMDELDLGLIAGKDFKWQNSSVFIRGRTNKWKTDLSLLLLAFREHFLLGFDLTRSIGGAGFWFEAAWVKPFLFNREKRDLADEKNYFRASVGLDYSFTGKMYSFFEYHFNSAGKSKAGDYADAFLSSAYRDGSVYLMGRHYLNLGITYQITPLIPFTGMVIMNLNDASFTLAPTAEYNIAENIYLGFGAYLGIGKRPGLLRTVPVGGMDRLLHSEFGTYPNMLYTSFRIYF